MDQHAKGKTIAVMGGGTFGIAVSWMLQNAGANVNLWCFLQEEVDSFNETGFSPTLLQDCCIKGVFASNSPAEVLSGAEAAIIVTPSFGVKPLAEQMAGAIADDIPVLILSKGLEPRSGRLFVDVVAEAIGNRERIAVLSGPNHAEELSRGALAGAVVASENLETARYFQSLLASDTFRLYASEDPVGASLCSASKNVIAIACGIVRGSGFGDNTLSLLLTRGLSEMTRLVLACGGSASTCLGLAGIGDLNATCNSVHSRNGMYGEAFAQRGISVADYEAERHMVVEGAHAVEPLLRLGAEKGVDLPIMKAVKALLDGEMTIEEAANSLMNRDLKGE